MRTTIMGKDKIRTLAVFTIDNTSFASVPEGLLANKKHLFAPKFSMITFLVFINHLQRYFAGRASVLCCTLCVCYAYILSSISGVRSHWIYHEKRRSYTLSQFIEHITILQTFMQFRFVHAWVELSMCEHEAHSVRTTIEHSLNLRNICPWTYSGPPSSSSSSTFNSKHVRNIHSQSSYIFIMALVAKHIQLTAFNLWIN